VRRQDAYATFCSDFLGNQALQATPHLRLMDFEIKADRGISAVCAVYNGEASLVELYHRLVSALSLLTTRFEIVFVNDHSPDKSGKIIASLADITALPEYVRISPERGFLQP
jgi:hypothetical protein